MTDSAVDYFADPPSPEEAVIRRIKGDFRKVFVARAIEQDGLASVPPQWTQHDLPELFKSIMQRDNPRRRGGEDLPDLEPGEVEIARISLADSVHGEVTSLRARRDPTGVILMRVVDEYANQYTLPRDRMAGPFTPKELVRFLAACDPNPTESECALRITSPFHDGLQEILDAVVAERRK